MASVTTTYITGDTVGIKEDVDDVIHQISPEETPFMSNIGRDSVENTFFEWLTDSLDTVDTSNHQVEGDDISTFAAVSAPSRIGNRTSISRKDFVISGTEESVGKYGRNSEVAYEIAQHGAALKRDMEAILLDNNASVTGARATASETGGFVAFIKTNVSKSATNGADPVWTSEPTDARSDGVQRAFVEADLKTVVKSVYDNGGDLDMLMLGSFNKQTASGFSGIAAQRYNAQGASPSTIIGAADIYVSDFGNLSIVPNRFQRSRDGLVVDTSRASLCVLRPMSVQRLAKTGDAEKRMLITEYGLKVTNEDAHGIVADLTTS